MKKKLVGVLVVISMLVFCGSAFAEMEFETVKFSGDVTFSVSSAAPAGLLNGSSSAALVVEELKKNGDSWSASSDGWIKYAAGDLFAFTLNKALDYALYDLDANIPENPGVQLDVGPATLVVNNQEYPTGSVAYNFGGGLSFSGDNYSLGVMANSTPVATEAYYGTSYGAKVTGSFAPIDLTAEVGQYAPGGGGASQLAYYLKGVYGLGAGNLVAYYKNAFSGTTTLYGGLENYQVVENTKFTVSATNTAGATTYLAKTVTTIASMMDLTLQVVGAPVVGTATLKVSF